MFLHCRLLGNKCGTYASSHSLLNSTCPEFGVGHELSSMTNETAWIAGRWLGKAGAPCFAVIDTPGIGDTAGSSKDCANFMDVARMARELSPIDGFLLVIKGDTTRITPSLLAQLQYFEDLFGEQFWRSTMIAISFWGHSPKAIKLRKRRGGLDEVKMAKNLNFKLKMKFPQIP